MVLRLSGWQRLGLVLTVIWIVGFVWLNRMWVAHKATANYSYALQACLRHQDLTERLGCIQVADAVLNSEMKPRWGGLLFAAAWPIPLFWMLGWLALWVGRWVHNGFENDRLRLP
jgi:hypothetical protein